MDKERKIEDVKEQKEHLVCDDAETDLTAHEQHADTLSECVAHDKPELDDRGCEKHVDPPKEHIH